MKKQILSLLFTCSVVAFTVTPVLAEDFKVPDRGIISVSGSSSDEFPPDTATISITIKTEAPNASEASQKTAQKSQNVMAKLNKLINKEKGDYVKTTSYQLYPIYDYNEPKKKNVLRGYSADNQITVVLKQINLVGQVIDTSVGAGADLINGIDFSLKDESQFNKNVLVKATEKAKTEANILAKTLGVKIVGVKQVSSSSGFNQPYNRTFKGMAMAAEVATPIEPQNVKVNANVNIDFYIDKQ